MGGKNNHTHPNNATTVSVQLDMESYHALKEMGTYSGKNMTETLKAIICPAVWAYKRQLIESKEKAARNVLMNSHVVFTEELIK